MDQLSVWLVIEVLLRLLLLKISERFLLGQSSRCLLFICRLCRCWLTTLGIHEQIMHELFKLCLVLTFNLLILLDQNVWLTREVLVRESSHLILEISHGTRGLLLYLLLRYELWLCDILWVLNHHGIRTTTISCRPYLLCPKINRLLLRHWNDHAPHNVTTSLSRERSKIISAHHVVTVHPSLLAQLRERRLLSI